MKKGTAALLTGMFSFGTGFFLGGKMLVGLINDYKMKMDRNMSNMLLCNDWLDFIYSGGHIDKYFHDNGYQKVMIYGNGYVGARLAQALAKTDIAVVAIMDKVASSDENGEVIGTDSRVPDNDCIIVTPVYYYNEIYDMLRKKTDIPIVSVQTVIGTK